MTRGNQSVTYRLTAATSGQAGLQKFTDTLERLLSVQERIKAQGDVIAGLQAQVAPAVAATRAQAQEEIRLARETAAAKKAAANDYASFWKTALSEQEQAEKAAQQAGMQRLRDRAATWRLNARLAADSERQAQVAIAETIRSLDNQQRAQRNLWQSGKTLAIDAVEGQRKIQSQALAAAAALDKESDAYRRLTGVAAAAERTANSALGRNTPGGFSHGVTLGIQNSGLMNYAATFGGPSAQALGIVASSFTGAKKAALEYGAASNTAATATGVMTAAGAALTLGVGALAVGLGSLGKVGLEQVGILQGGLNVLSANGVQDLAAVQRQIDSLKVNLGQVGKSFTTADLTASAADIVKAGVSVDQAMQVMAGSTKLAAAEQTNLNDASGQLLKNLRQYELDLSKSGEVADMFAKAGNLAAGSANDLSVGFGIVGTTGRQAKIEMYDLLGMLVELDNKGMDAADVGANGLRTAIAALGDPTDKARGILAGLRIELEDSAGQARPAGDVMKDLGERMRGMGVTVNAATGELEGNGEALRTVSGLMDTRAAAAVLALTGDWKTYGQQVKNSAGYADEYATTMTQGVVPAQQRVRVAFADAGLALAKGFAGPLADLLDDVVTPGIETLGRFVGALNEVKSPGELTATLKITTNDDFTSAVMKLLIGGGQVVKQGLFTPAPGQQNAFELLKGLLPAEPDLTLKRLPVQPLVGQPNLGLPLPSGTPADPKRGSAEFAYGFISSLADVFKNDPAVASDCAIIASKILATLGVKIEASSNAGVLEKNAKTAGFQRVEGDEIKPGDLIVWTSGNGKTYGMTSGKHVGVAAGYQHGQLMVINNPGQSNTVVEPMYDRQNAVAYRAPTSPFAGAAPSASAGQAAPALSPNARLRATIDEGKHLIAQYQLALQGGNEIWQAKANAALEQWKKTHKEALGGVKDELAALGKMQRGGGRPEETDLQREQRLRAEAVALDQLTASLRKASSARLDAIIAGGVQKEGDLQRITLAETELARRGKLSEQAAAQAKTAREKAAREGDQAAKAAIADQVRMAEQAAAELGRLQTEQRDTAARVAKEARELRVAAAEGTLARLKELNQQEVSAFQGTAEQRLAMIRRQSQAEYDAAVQVAQAKKAADLRDSANAGGPNRGARDTLIRQAYTDALTALAGDRRAAVQTALKDVNDAADARAIEGLGQAAERTQGAVTAFVEHKRAVIDLRAEYHRLAEGIREQVKAGEFDDDAKLKAQRAFNALGQAARDAGIDGDEYVRGARITTNTLISQGRAASDAATRLQDQAKALDAVVAAGRRLTLGTLGDRTDTELTSLYSVAQGQGDTELAQAVLDEIERRAAETNRRITDRAVEMADEARDLIRQRFEQDQAAAADASVTVESLTTMIGDLVDQGLDPHTSGFLDWLKELVQGSGQAAVAAQEVIDTLDQLIFRASKPLPMSGPVDARGTLTPGPTEVAARGTLTPTTLTEVSARGALTGDQVAFQQRVESKRLTDEYAASLGKLTDEQLEQARAAALAAGNQAQYDLIVQAQSDRTQAATKAATDLASAQSTLAGIQRDVAQAMGETQTPYAAQIETLEALKEKYPELTAAIDQLITALHELQNASAQQSGFNQLKQNIEQVGQIVQGLFSMFGAQQTAQGIGELTSAVTGGMEAFTKFTTGDIVGGVMAAIGALANLGKAIDNLNPAIIRQKKEWADLAQAEQQAMGSKMVGGSSGMNGFVNPYYAALKADSDALTRKVNAGFWERLGWDLFGNAPQTLDKAASESLQKAAAVFNDFAGSLYSTLENELMSASEKNDYSQVSINTGKMLDQFVRRLKIQAIIARSRLGDLAKEFADEVAAGQDTSGTQAEIDAEIAKVTGEVQASVPSPAPGTASDAPASTPAGDPVVGSTFYVANSSKIDLFDDVIQRADAMYLRHEGVLTLHSAAMTAHAAALDRSTAMYDRLLRDGVPLRDSQGGLAAVLR